MPTTVVGISFRCSCEGRVDVLAAVKAIAHGDAAVSSNSGRTEHEGRVKVPGGTADEATALLRAAVDGAATDAGTTCEITIFSATPR